ncbi:hypothetical protein KP509_10G010100 [Ceratopteris richardii]|nr:hypothetical protein KP509_10G010100 [Ceratopteris richardii]
MFQNVVNALMAHADHLQHICLQTSDKHYTMNSTVMLDPPFSEHMPRLHTLNVYHSLEDILLNAVAKKEGVTWSIHRPSIVLGFSPWSYTNLIGSLAMYATICKHEGLPFQFLGNKKSWERFVDAADANLIASQEVWACLDQNGKNQVFNVANGDVISVKRLWKVVADEFGLEVPTPYYGKTITTLEEVMSEKDEVWDEIVRIHDLHTTKLSEVGCWWYVDSVLNATSSSVLNLNKSKELGFTSFRNTEVAIIHWIHELRRKRFIP